MTTTSMRDLGLAILTGAAFTGGALYILLEDVVVKGHPWTMAHGLAVLTVLGVIGSGHLSYEAWKARHVGAALGFVLVAIAGTALVVFNSVGRQTEANDTSVLSAEDRNDKRAKAEASRAANQKMLDAERRKYTAQCKSGNGTRCKGIEASVAVYESAVRGDKAELAALGPAEPVAPKAESFAALLALLGYDKGKSKAALMLGEPFLNTLLFELGAIVSWSYVFGRRRTPATQPNRDQQQTSFPPDDDELPDPRQFGPEPSNSSTVRRFTKDEAAADLVTRLALGERFASQDELAQRYGRRKSTVSDWLAEWERSGVIPARTQVGRCKALSGCNAGA